jgi:hypothetical protein
MMFHNKKTLLGVTEDKKYGIIRAATLIGATGEVA